MDRFSVCPLCLQKGLEIKLDKTGRPFFSCLNCSTKIFVRGGTLAVGNMLATCKMLESQEVSLAVRRQGIAASELLMAGKLREILGQPSVTPYAIADMREMADRKVA